MSADVDLAHDLSHYCHLLTYSVGAASSSGVTLLISSMVRDVGGTQLEMEIQWERTLKDIFMMAGNVGDS